MNQATRIGLLDDPLSSVVKLAEGNPGATVVMGQLLRDGNAIDPDGAFGGFGVLLGFDSLGIYGPSIWLLYKDICGENIRNVCMIVRAWQLGFLPSGRLRAAIEYTRRPNVAQVV